MGKVLKGNNDRRWRIEHAQVVTPEDREMFGNFNIIPSVQPTHAISDMAWAEARLGDRIDHAYSLKGLMNQNGMIPLGTDFPVEDISPLGTFYTAVARRNADWEPREGFLIEEALTREEALKGITIWAAMANFDEQKYGSIETGKFADFVVVNLDLLNCAEDQIMNAEILSTWIQGVKRYGK
jgi:predicted amidohydrolase YtcJ